MYGAMVYFVVFICVGAFVFANFVIAVIITHLHIAIDLYEDSSMVSLHFKAMMTTVGKYICINAA